MSGYGRVFAAWREAAGPLWQDYVAHEFVAGMADGSLPRPAFLRYLVQDYIFLIHFSRAWALAVTKAETVGEMRLAAGTVNAMINDEIALHVRICGEAGISEAELFGAEEHAANIAYTRYVLDAGHSGDFLDLMAALAPCVLGYGEIGARLAREAAADTAYGEWIATYAGDDYQGVCRDVGALIDGAVVRRLGERFEDSPRWAGLVRHFRVASRLEAGFWDMGLHG